MADAEIFVESVLAHYASPYYDPAKAHEYYLRTRELSGRTSTSELSPEQKDIWKVSKSNIDKAKASESKSITEKHAANTQQIQLAAQKRQVELRNAIQKLFEKLSADRKAAQAKTSDYVDKALNKIAEQRKAKLEKIAADTQSKLDNLPPLPENSSREDLIKRSEEIAKIKGDAKAKASDVNGAAKAQAQELKTALVTQRTNAANRDAETTKQMRAAAKANSDKLASDLRASIDRARKSYEALKEQQKAKYESIYQNELQAISQDPSS